jgi:hypothetical protein
MIKATAEYPKIKWNCLVNFTDTPYTQDRIVSGSDTHLIENAPFMELLFQSFFRTRIKCIKDKKQSIGIIGGCQRNYKSWLNIFHKTQNFL